MNTSLTRRFLSLALLTDAVTLVAMLVLIPRAAEALAEPSGISTLYLALVYILFLAGIFMLRKLRPVPPATGDWLSPAVRGMLAGLFGLALTTLLAWQLGFFRSFPSADPMVLGEGEAAAYFVFAPGAWIGVSMLYILFLAFPVNETVGTGDGCYLPFALVGLLGSGLMLAMMVAQGQPVLPAGNAALWAVLALLLLALLFIPPRLLYASRFFPVSSRATVIAVVSLLVVLAAGAWLAVS
jgi:hypothetical protein